MPNHKYSRELVLEWARLRSAGLTYREIGAKFFAPAKSVCTALNIADLIKPKGGQAEWMQCLRCDKSFMTRRDRRGIPERRLCAACTKFNQYAYAGALFL